MCANKTPAGTATIFQGSASSAGRGARYSPKRLLMRTSRSRRRSLLRGRSPSGRGRIPISLHIRGNRSPSASKRTPPQAVRRAARSRSFLPAIRASKRSPAARSRQRAIPSSAGRSIPPRRNFTKRAKNMPSAKRTRRCMPSGRRRMKMPAARGERSSSRTMRKRTAAILRS